MRNGINRDSQSRRDEASLNSLNQTGIRRGRLSWGWETSRNSWKHDPPPEKQGSQHKHTQRARVTGSGPAKGMPV
eukprot:364783-Chlamydomonas_euryale.AAC.3